MTTELQILAWSIVLGFAQISVTTMMITKIRGPAWNVSARDEKQAELTGVTGRLDRATQNFKETFPFFVAAVVISEFVSRATGKENHLSAIGAHIYFWSRVIYVPLYAAGVPVVRTFVWTASIVGILMVLSTAILAV